MNVGLVLAKTPAYSETFFISKIKGLKQSGIHVTLFVQSKEAGFSLCPVRVAPKLHRRNILRQLWVFMVVLLKLLVHYGRFRHFIRLEQQAGRSVIQGLKNAYNNVHILTSDLDWLHFGFATMALQSEHVAKAIGAKMAVSFRGFDLDVYPLKKTGCYDLVWQHVNKVHSISLYLLDKAHKIGLTKAIPSSIISPAIESDLIDSNCLKTNWSKPIQFITVGRLHWIKGYQATLEALSILNEMGIDFRYRIIGEGPEQEALMFGIHQLGLTHRAHLIGKLSHKDTLEAMSQSDVYIQYSYSEGFCNAVLEAQALGLFCIVSDGGGLMENVLDKQTGWVVPKGQPKLLAKKLLEVINLPEKEKLIILESAKNRIREEYLLDAQIKAFKAFYE